MKEIFENKNKLYLFSIVLFLLTAIILKLLPNNIGNLVSYIIFPLFFMSLTLFYYKKNKINWNLSIVLTFVYLIIGYICIPKIITPLKVIIAYLFSAIPLLIIKLLYRLKKEEINQDTNTSRTR